MANKLIDGKIFGDLVKDYTEGMGTLLSIAKKTDYKAEKGTKVEFPVANFLGDAIEVKNGKATYTDVSDAMVEAKFIQIDKGVKFEDMELKNSHLDRTMALRSKQIAESLVSKKEKMLLATLDTQTEYKVAKLDANAVIEAQGLMGEKLNQREHFLIGNGKVIAELLKEITRGNLTNKATEIYDSKVVRFDGAADGVFYIIQKDVLELLEGSDINVETFRQADFKGIYLTTDEIVSSIITEYDRAVKVVLDETKTK